MKIIKKFLHFLVFISNFNLKEYRFTNFSNLIRYLNYLYIIYIIIFILTVLKFNHLKYFNQ